MSDTTDEMIPDDVEETTQEESVEEEEPSADELAGAFWDVIKKFEEEDEQAHRTFFNEAIIGEHYWNNRQHVYLRTIGAGYKEVAIDDQSQMYTANEYRPNGESIIAAMAVAPPQVNFFPDDANVSDDIATAAAYQRIAELVQKHNDAISLITRILFILYNQHFVAVYNYNKTSYKFGTYKKDTYEDVDESVDHRICPSCGRNADELNGPPYTCPDCGEAFDTPEVVTEISKVKRLVGHTNEPKARECLHAFGNTHVKVAPWAQKQEDTPYLTLRFEQHPSKAKYDFSEHKDLLGKGPVLQTTEYERDNRSQLYRGEFMHLDTWTITWLRPSTYNLFGDKVEDYLEKTYPEGIKVTFINGTMVDIDGENLDDHWTINDNSLSTYIHGEPLGKAGIPLQDATNELLNLSMDTVKHGIPQTFATSTLIDFDRYKSSEVAPGKMWPTKPLQTGDQIGNHIHTTRTATLSQEVQGVREGIRQQSQLATGAFPSIYGGNIQGSRTASEYAQSRNQALQRLSITWNMVKSLWAKVMSKSCRSYAKSLVELGYDDKQVKKDGTSYINIWVKRAELTGNVGDVEPEIDEQLPTSWAQLRDVLMRLIEMNVPMINDVLSDPNNSTLVKGALGFRDIKIPGYDSRLKQLDEIQRMTTAESEAELSSVEVDERLDDHAVEADVCKTFLISPIGQGLKLTNPPVYERVYQHWLKHDEIVMRMMQALPENNPKQVGA